MPWRHWSVIVVLILANYVVFSIIGALLFPVTPSAFPAQVTRPTFTAPAPPLERVGTLTYDFMRETPTVTETVSASTPTPRTTVVPTATP